MPHFYRNWKGNDLRRLVLNSICWSAKLEVPAGGVESSVPRFSQIRPGGGGTWGEEVADFEANVGIRVSIVFCGASRRA